MKKQEHVAKSIGVRTGPRAATAASHSPAGTFARSSSSRRAFTFLLASSLAVVFIGLIAAGASAVELRSFSSSFGAPGTGNGQLELRTHSSVAINQSTGNVYVSDTGNGRVAEFKADGTFIRNFGSFTTPTFIAVDGSAGGEGNVYVADSGTNTVSKFNGEGTPITTWAGSGQLSGLGALAGIAVSPTGDFFVLEENSTNRKYSPAGVELSSFGSPRGTSPFGLAIDTEGNLYQADGSPEITKYTQTGENLGEPDTRGDAVALATDSNNGDLYVVQGNNSGFVNRYAMNCGQACTPIEGFGEGELSDPQGIALNATTHDVYVANAGSSTIGIAKIEDVEPAEATLGPASEVEYITATVSGEVNPKGHTTSCRFEYVTDEQFSGTDERQSLRVSASAGTYTLEFLGDVTAPLPFDATAPEIETALNSLNSIGGAGGSVHVTAKPQQSFSRFYDIVFGGTLGKHDVEELAAHGDGLIGREESASPSTFDQGHAPAGFSEPSAVACATNPGSGSGFTPVSAKLVSLRANTSYHYRLSARLTTTADPGGTFQTKVVTPPVVSIDSVTDITSSTARVVGHITPGGTDPAFDTIWYVECHGCNGGQNNPVIPGDIASHEVSTEVEGLKPGGEATVEIVAENSGGRTKSGSLHFKALGVSPTVSATYVSAVGNDSATLNALVNPGGSLTTFHFEYVTKAQYEADGFDAATAAPVPDQALPGVNERQRIERGFQSEPFLSVALGGQSSVTFPATAGAAEVQGALEGIPAIGTGGVEVTDVRAGVWEVEFTGALAETDVEQLEVFPLGRSEVLREGGPPTSFADHPAATELQGLQTGVEYVYRLVASNEYSSAAGVTGPPAYFFTVPKPSPFGACSNDQLRSENQSTALPDCRAFEAVSGPRDGEVYPPFTADREVRNGGQVQTSHPSQAALSGNVVTYPGVPPRHGTGEGTGGPGIQNSGDQYIATRSATGWSAADVMPRGRGIDPEVGGYYGFSDNLSTGVLMLRHALPEVPLTPEVTAKCDVLYSRSLPLGAFDPFYLTEPCGEPIYVGSSADGSKQVFESSAAMTSGTSDAPGEGQENLYYKTSTGLFAINVLPNGATVPSATVGALAEERLVISEPLIPPVSASHAIAPDGSSVVWTDLTTGIVYVRQNPEAASECSLPGETGKACSIQVSAGSAIYQDASPGGRYVYYTEAGELWRFDVSDQTRQVLAGPGASVLGTIGLNTSGQEGAYLYFVAEGALAPDAEERTCSRAKEREDPQERAEAKEEAEGESPLDAAATSICGTKDRPPLLRSCLAPTISFKTPLVMVGKVRPMATGLPFSAIAPPRSPRTVAPWSLCPFAASAITPIKSRSVPARQ